MLKNSKSKFVYYGLAWIPPLTLKKKIQCETESTGFLSYWAPYWVPMEKKETTGKKLILHNYQHKILNCKEMKVTWVQYQQVLSWPFNL